MRTQHLIENYPAWSEWAVSVREKLSTSETQVNRLRSSRPDVKLPAYVFAILNDPYTKDLQVFTIMTGQAADSATFRYQGSSQKGLVRVCPIEGFQIHNKEFMDNIVSRRVVAVRTGKSPPIVELSRK